MDTLSKEPARTSSLAMRDAGASLMEVAVTTSVFSYADGHLRVLAVRNPGSNVWRLPTYAFTSGMSLHDAATLAVRRVTRVPVKDLFQIGAVTTPGENSEAPAVEVGFLSATWMPNDDVSLADAPEETTPDVRWVDVTALHELETSSRQLLQAGLTELRRRARFDRIAFSLLPPEFSLSELQRVFEVVIGKSIDVRNFRKKMESLHILTESPHRPRGMAHRPPRLYSFSEALFRDRLEKEPEVRFF